MILIQSGNASLGIAKPKKNVEILQVGQGQIAGEQGLSGVQTHNLSLVAVSDVKYMEVPMDAARAQVEAAPQFLKMVVKSVLDRARIAVQELRASAMDRDQTPCAEDQVAKAFGVVYHTARHKGKSEDEKNPAIISMDWVPFKQYGQRVFGDSPKRMEQVCNIFVKLKMATYTMGKPDDNPDGPDEIKQVNFLDLGFIESFFEFYQYYYFKGGIGTYLKYDETCANIVTHLLKAVEGAPVDKNFIVSIEFAKVIEFFKTEANLNLTTAQFSQLEAKGLFCRRQTRSADNQVILSFDLREWKTVAGIWKVLLEIEKWNEKGSVDMTEDISKPKKKAGGGPTCPSCNVEVASAAKFCHECGAKLESKAA